MTVDVAPPMKIPTTGLAAPDDRVAQRRTNLALGVIVLLLCAIGVGARLHLFQINRPFSLDEGMLINNVQQREMRELLKPLDYSQAAPPGFLATVKWLTQRWGITERIVRSFPLACGILSLPLIFIIGRSLGGFRCGAIAAALFAVAGGPIEYSAEFKQYSVDIFVTCALLACTLSVLGANGIPGWRMVLLALLGAAAVWMSHPSIFVLGGGAAALGLRLWRRRMSEPNGWIVAGLIGLFWAASFVTSFSLAAARTSKSSSLTSFWWAQFMPFSIHLIRWLPNALAELFRPIYATPESSIGLGAALVCAMIGAGSLVRRRTEVIVLIGTTLLLTLAASAARVYPFGSRLLLFTVPLTVLLVAEGLLALARLTAGYVLVFPAALAVVLFYPSIATVYDAIHPVHRDDIRSLTSSLLKEIQTTGDSVILMPEAEPGFSAYERMAGAFGSDAAVWGSRWGGRRQETTDPLAGRHTGSQFWVVIVKWGAPPPGSWCDRRLESLLSRVVAIRSIERDGAAAVLMSVVK